MRAGSAGWLLLLVTVGAGCAGAGSLRGLVVAAHAQRLERVVGWPVAAVAVGDTVYVNGAWLVALAPSTSSAYGARDAGGCGDGGCDGGAPDGGARADGGATMNTGPRGAGGAGGARGAGGAGGRAWQPPPYTPPPAYTPAAYTPPPHHT